MSCCFYDFSLLETAKDTYMLLYRGHPCILPLTNGVVRAFVQFRHFCPCSNRLDRVPPAES